MWLTLPHARRLALPCGLPWRQWPGALQMPSVQLSLQALVLSQGHLYKRGHNTQVTQSLLANWSVLKVLCFSCRNTCSIMRVQSLSSVTSVITQVSTRKMLFATQQSTTKTSRSLRQHTCTINHSYRITSFPIFLLFFIFFIHQEKKDRAGKISNPDALM